MFTRKSSSLLCTSLALKLLKKCNIGGSPSYIVNLDMKKAFYKLWRDVLLYKLIDKIDNIYWRAIANYYANSSGKVKINGELSMDFKMSDEFKHLVSFFI
jgi:hypothetical protein